MPKKKATNTFLMACGRWVSLETAASPIVEKKYLILVFVYFRIIMVWKFFNGTNTRIKQDGVHFIYSVDE